MALEIGESGQFQLDFAVTKIVTVLIFAIFLPSGHRSGPIKAPQTAGNAPIASNILYVGSARQKSCGGIGIDLRLISQKQSLFHRK